MTVSVKAQPWHDVGDRYAAQVNAAGNVAFITDKLNPKIYLGFDKAAARDLAKILGLVAIDEATARAIIAGAPARMEAAVLRRCLRHGVDLLHFMEHGKHDVAPIQVAPEAECPDCRRL